MQAKAFVPEEDDLERLINQAEQLLASKAANGELSQPRAGETAPATPNFASPAEDGIIATTEANEPDIIDRLRASIAARVQEEEKQRVRSWLIDHGRFARILFFFVMLLVVLITGAAFFAARSIEPEAISSLPEATAAIPPVVTEGRTSPAFGVPARRQPTSHR